LPKFQDFHLDSPEALPRFWSNFHPDVDQVYEGAFKGPLRKQGNLKNLRLQPFKKHISPKGQIYSYGCINSVTIYICVIYSIYMVTFYYYCLCASMVSFLVTPCQISHFVSKPS
jgi:hypothetical protein